MKDYYKILGVKPSDDINKIKKISKKKILQYHPDKNEKDDNKIKHFQLILEAYQILTDPYEKGKYDFQYNMNNNSKTNTNVSSYTFTSTTINNNGNIKTKKNIKTNINGSKNNYFTEFTINKDGEKTIIKEEGNSDLLNINKLKINNF